MTRAFERIAVVGLGLLGGSVGRAAKERGVAAEVVGISRGRDSARAAADGGFVDRGVVDVAEGLAGAGLVVLATPVFAMAETLERMAPHLAAGAIVTDVGSVKAMLVDTLPGLLPKDATFVGSHPMAGSHMSGLRHARADLFDGARCVVTPGPTTPADATARVEAFWRALGAAVVRRSPAAHDAEVAWVSHAPHAVAFAFATAFAQAPAEAGALAGSGFRDFTRIAKSEPELWADILLTNRKALGAPLEAVGTALGELGRALASGEADAIERFIAAGREALASAANDARSGGGNPDIQVAKVAASKE